MPLKFGNNVSIIKRETQNKIEKVVNVKAQPTFSIMLKGLLKIRRNKTNRGCHSDVEKRAIVLNIN
jgi:hypothetical protein